MDLSMEGENKTERREKEANIHIQEKLCNNLSITATEKAKCNEDNYSATSNEQ